MARRKSRFAETLSKDFLSREYVENKKSIRRIALEVGCSAQTIKDYLDIRQIDKRKQWDHPNSHNKTIQVQEVVDGYVLLCKTVRQLASEFDCSCWFVCKCLHENDVLIKRDVRDYTGPPFSEHELREMYCEDKKTISEIADIVGMSKSTMRLALKKFGIPIRNGLESQLKYTSNEDDHRYRDEHWLHKKYVEEHKNSAEIASMCNAGKTTIKRWLKKHGIPTRSNSESHVGHVRTKESRRKQAKTVTGVGNHFYGREHTDETKELIRVQNSGTNASRYGKSPEWSWCEYEDTKGVVHKFQSSWELAYAEYLDSNNIEWVSHKGMRRFKYVDAGGVDHTYAPDFYLPETNEYIEIKGWFPKQAQYKMYQVAKNYPAVKINILMYEQLSDMGVL